MILGNHDPKKHPWKLTHGPRHEEFLVENSDCQAVLPPFSAKMKIAPAEALQLVREGASLSTISNALNALSQAERIKTMYTFSARDQARLYEIATGNFCSLSYFVPREREGKEVIHWGHNSLPFFTRFQKIMTSHGTGENKQYGGYNEQTMKAITGPGYFKVRIADKGPHDQKQLVIDYRDEPDFRLSAWPEIIPNSARLSRFIYYQTQDFMWKVSDHLSIGRAYKDNAFMDNWFILVRDEEN